MQIPLRLFYTYGFSIAGSESERLRNLYNARYAVSRFAAALLSAWFSLQLLNETKPAKVEEILLKRSLEESQGRSNVSFEAELSARTIPVGTPSSRPVLAGKTIDLTILAVARTLDTLIVNTWRRYQSSRYPTTILKALSRHTDTGLFAISSGTIMWAWFYHPDRLPLAYNKWIGSVAQVDSRLISFLREARSGRLIYGTDTGHVPILQSMCKEYDWPLAWGDPERTVPIPCEVVHMGTGPSCHWHAAVRFARAFKFALATNLPLQLLVKARKPSMRAFRRACEEAMRSSAFLGAFVALFYHGVCLSRTRLGPNLVSRNTITPQMWDSGLCVGAGCMLCGWSILIEAAKRREELSMFVAPRALATWLPREYNVKVRLP